MKLFGYILLPVMVCVILGFDTIAYAHRLIDDPSKELTDLNQRILNGDYSAFSEVAKLNSAEGINYLESYLDLKTTQPNKYELARFALMNIPSILEKYKTNLANATKEGTVDENTFDGLAMIGTEKAISVVAPYLFDFTTRPNSGDDVADGATTAFSAAVSLGNMEIKGAPAKNNDFQILDDETDVILWQKWAITKGLVPKEWSSRVGLVRPKGYYKYAVRFIAIRAIILITSGLCIWKAWSYYRSRLRKQPLH